jgi:hypothetical protein
VFYPANKPQRGRFLRFKWPPVEEKILYYKSDLFRRFDGPRSCGETVLIYEINVTDVKCTMPSEQCFSNISQT